MFQLFPRNTVFFEYFQQQAALAVKATDLLVMLDFSTGRTVNTAEFSAIEHDGDQVTRTALRKLVQSFITPLDREDIHALVTTLDDILDAIDELATLLSLFEIRELPTYFREMAKLAQSSASQLADAFDALPNTRDYLRLPIIARRIGELESQCDDIYHQALADLFRSPADPILTLKWRELYERMERVLDIMQRAGNQLEMIGLKHG